MHEHHGQRSLTGDAGSSDIKRRWIITTALRDGVQYDAAGSILSTEHAEINYFTGRPPIGHDEIQWVQKSYGLLDRLQAQTATAATHVTVWSRD